MVKSSQLIGKLGKGLGAAGKIFSLLDTVAMVDKVSKNTAPILEKAIDRHYDQRRDLIDLPDVIHLPLDKAQEHLEGLGLLVNPVLARPDQVDRHNQAGEVVAMVPKSGKVKPSSLIKLYYTTEDNLVSDQLGFNLDDLKGLPLEEAKSLLQEEGFKVVSLPFLPDRKYSQQPLDTVLATEPKQQLMKTSLKKGSLVKLFYLNQEALAKSQALEADYLAKKEEQRQALLNSMSTIKSQSNQSLQQLKKLAQDGLDKARDRLSK